MSVMTLVWALTTETLPQQKTAQEVLVKLQNHPDAWQRVDLILEFSSNQETKVLFSLTTTVTNSQECVEIYLEFDKNYPSASFLF